MIINGVCCNCYESPYKKIEEQQETINTLTRQIKALEESEQFYKGKAMGLLEKLELISKMRW